MEKSNVPDFETATGTIDYGFTNDYVFRKILQENNDVLKGAREIISVNSTL